MTGEPEDMELIQAFCRGDESAFEMLYYRYKRQLYGFLCNLTGSDHAEADEVFEETWLRVIDKLPKYRDDGRFSAWLFRLARNIFIDRFRKKSSRSWVEIDADDVPELPDWSRRPDRDLENDDIAGMIDRALDSLPEDQKEVFLLRQQELSFKEIASVQQCSINTVLGRMHYALKSLRKFIERFDNGGVK